MERWTISSTAPQLADLPGLTNEEVAGLRGIGIGTPLQLAESSSADLTMRTDLDSRAAARAVQIARLVTLRGIGTDHGAVLTGLGIWSVCDLAQQNANELRELIQNHAKGTRPTLSEVRVWVRAASRACP
jgi:predicted flap endonuclease-1-like 5' DNA nuclease